MTTIPPNKTQSSGTARDKILGRLRDNSTVRRVGAPLTQDRELDWQKHQPKEIDLLRSFQENQEGVGGKIIQVADWDALPDAVAPWFEEYRVNTAMTGVVPRLEKFSETLEKKMGIKFSRYDKSLEEQKSELFSVDCGITTTLGGIADTGSVIIWPTPEEPRLLSLAMPVYLALVERKNLYPNMAAFIETKRYQKEIPTNFVLATGASRTADIEQTLTIGVHGPKVFLVALIGEL